MVAVDVRRRRAAPVHPVDERRRHRDRVLQVAAHRTAQRSPEMVCQWPQSSARNGAGFFASPHRGPGGEGVAQ